MKSGAPIAILDPYDWLPEYGETGVSIRSEGLTWIVDVAYDDPSGEGSLRRELRFEGVCCFHAASFPGVPMLAIEFEAEPGFGSLLEYPESEAAMAWTAHFGKTSTVREYRLGFLSENRMIHVFAKRFVLGEPVRVQ